MITPVAIVGIGCRFPGAADDPVSFWRLLVDGRSAVGDVPPDRWSLPRYYHPDRAAAGCLASRSGGFIDGLSSFDARFWGIAPREAVRMDPQQRWLLEVAWEAIEDAGIAPSRLRGSNAGVFVGISGNDYGGLQLSDAEQVDAYTNSGNTASIASNRISYMLDLRGPSLSVDTACSSSLVAVAMACDALWSGTCELALAGGVNALISPLVSIGFSKASMLSPSGRCSSFDARADGYVRAEGAGIVLLKPLARAIADGDRIYAVVRGAAVNQDGHTSSMTVPSVEGQAAMLQQAYARAGVSPARVAYVEAHGTGTPIGDPIEAAALGRVIGAGRVGDRVCPIGSVKTNIGHLESASGIAGLIKAALVARHGRIPPSLNYERPNPQIPFEALGLTVAAQPRLLVATDCEPPLVGVNSFGFGGTNAHVVLEAPPRPDATDRVRSSPARLERANRPFVLPISARDESALRAYVQRYRTRLDEVESTADLCAAAGSSKDHHAHRLAIFGQSREELCARARMWLRDGQSVGVVAGRAASSRQPVFVFTGQGAQWWAMGRGLVEREPIVRRRLEDIDARLQSLAGWSLIEELGRDEATSRIDRTDIAQPALFALQAGLCDLWRSWGIQPAAVVGHSVGELAAAWCAGIYSLDDAVTILFHRSRLQQTTEGLGGMLVVAVGVEEARELLEQVRDVEIAAVNSPRLVTLSGDSAGLETVERLLAGRGIFARWVRIEYAFHSYQMDPLRAELLASLSHLQPRAAAVPFISTVTGAEMPGTALDAAYWWRNVREPVQFAAAMATLVRDGRDVFLELGPHPALESAVADGLAALDTTGAVFHSLRREADDTQELMTTLAALYARGAAIDWQAVNQGKGTFVSLPPYPWTRESYWLEPPASAEARLSGPLHPLLGCRVHAAVPTWQTSIDLHRLPYLSEHRIWDRAVFPASAFAEIGLAVAAELFPGESCAIDDLELQSVLVLSDEAPTRIQVVCTPEDRRYSVFSAASERHSWQLHATGSLSRQVTSVRPPSSAVDRLRRSGRFYSRDEYRRRWAERGYRFGPSFQLVDGMWCGEEQAVIEIDVPGPLAMETVRYTCHPALLDACFHILLGLQLSRDDEPVDDLFLPELIARLRVHRPMRATRFIAHGRLISDDRSSLVADIQVTDDAGHAVADILGFRARPVDTPRHDSIDDCFYRFEWQPRHLRGSRATGSCRFPKSADIVREVEAAAAAISQHRGIDDYRQARAAEDDVVCRLVVNAFLELGWQPELGERVTLDELVARLGIAAEHRRATRRGLRDIAAHGWLQATGADAWTVSRSPIAVDAAAALDELAARHPAIAANVALLRLTGLQLAAVLRGDVDAVSLLFPKGSTEPLERFYREGVSFPGHLDAFGLALTRALAELPADRALRVLEVGAGTGALTSTVLRVLPPGRTEYCFTDAGSAFLNAARQRFSEYAFIDYQLVDIDQDLAQQGVTEGGFDLVVASDALHAAADLRQTLRRLRGSLAPGGMLLFMELVTRDFPLVSATFGLLKGWWNATDVSLRPEPPLLDRDEWLQLLGDSGFDDAATVSSTPDPRHAEHAVFMAFRPTAAGEATGTLSQRHHYVVVPDASGVADALVAELTARGHRADLAEDPDAGSAGAMRRLLDAGGEWSGIIDCRPLSLPRADDLTLARLHEAQEHGLLRAFSLIQRVIDSSTPVWFATRHLQAVTAADPVHGLAAAPLIGLTRVANTEQQCRFYLVDLDDGPVVEAARQLADEVTLPRDGDFETAYRGGQRYGSRLRPANLEAGAERTLNAVSGDGTLRPFRLQNDKPGVLANLTLRETLRPAPSPSEIEVRVRAGGINFRDVMKALGTLPGAAADRFSYGDDFAGIVERVGHAVTRFRPGDEVAGMSPSAFRSFAIAEERMAFRKPSYMSFEDAATIPTVFLTAHYALRTLAQLQPGEKVLIHAGAGGVGLAAIQIARRLSLQIFATAGTPEKRALLAKIGVPHVLNSRTLEFADEIMDLTSGRGVDAVLNSLAGEFIPRSLSLLAPFGRFVEIGKADIYKNTKIGLRPLRDNISYFVVDLTQHMLHRPEVVAGIFHDLAEEFNAGVLEPLPYTAFSIGQAVDAFRHMAQGKHIGKNVLTFDPGGIRVGFNRDDHHLFRSDATYLVVGGAGGFGLAVAQWIATHGGRHLVLMSRSGPSTEAQGAIDRLRSQGVQVVDWRGDVTRAADVERAIDAISEQLPPLKGVFHAAMVMDDEFVAGQDAARIRRVLDPKMAGGWNLHETTKGLELEHFVCFSSFSNVIGVPKQASYNAGNAFLDQLAHYRRTRGLPALSINFGALLGAGFVARDRQSGDALARLGFGAFHLDEALAALQRLLFVDGAQMSAARVDWDVVLRLSPLVGTAATYKHLLGTARDAGQSGSLLTRLRAANEDERGRLVQDFIVAQVAGVFGMAEDRIDRGAPLTTLGLDSLMILELTNRVEREIGLRLPMASLLSGPTVSELGQTVLRLLAPTLASASSAQDEAPEASTCPTPDPRVTTDIGVANAVQQTVGGRALDAAGHILPLQHAGGPSAVFAFHPVGGGVGLYAAMASHLPPDVALYGVESRLNRGADREYDTLDEMVERYAAAVREVSAPPYRLFGYSLGGYLAARVAERLEAAGLDVEAVGVVDWGVTHTATAAARRDGLIELAAAGYVFAQQDIGLVRELTRSELRSQIAPIVDAIFKDRSPDGQRFWRWIVEQRLVVSPALEPVARQQLLRFERHCLLLAQPCPLPRFRAPLLVWRAERGLGSGIAEWQHHGSMNREYALDADHNSIARVEALQRIAAQLSEFLADITTVPAGRPAEGRGV